MVKQAASKSFNSEASFQHFVLSELNKIGMFFTKEAGSIRGLPDVMGVCNGHFCALELKKSLKEMSQKTGRIALQKHWLLRFQDQKGFAQLACPENWEQVYSELCKHCKIDPQV